jgi:hypothetical protein
LRHRQPGPSAHSLESTIVIGRLHLAQSGQSATVAVEISELVYEKKEEASFTLPLTASF